MARISPGNRTGTGGEDLLSNNFNWNLPLVGLNGRGLDLGLTLSYNSLVWVRSGNYIDYDVDDGSIAPGFRLGFPTVEGPYWNDQANAYFYLLVTPSGARVELRYVGGNAYEAQDSTYLQLLDYGSSLLVRSTDGTQLNFVSIDSSWRCNQIKDRNGNYQTITYNSQADISTITDTLGRVLTFNYDGYFNLSSITQAGRTQPWATFGWGTASITHSFSLTNLGPNNTTIPVLTRVGLSDGSFYEFYYNGAGQVMKVARAASDGWHHSYTVYDYDYSTVDCPRLTQTRDWATNWSDQYEVPHEVSTYFTHDADGGCRMTMPDGTVYKEFYGSSWQSGLTTETRSYASVTDANANVWQKRTTATWTQDNISVAYQTNPRVIETNVYDANNNRRRTTIGYQTFTLPDGASCSLPNDVVKYAADATSILQRTQTYIETSTTFTDRRIIGLTWLQTVSDGAGNLVSKRDFQYDWGGGFMADQGATVQHDSSYGTGFLNGRGNLVVIRQFDINDPNNNSLTHDTRTGYNTNGSVVFLGDASWHTTSFNYADSFSDNVNRNTFAYPTAVTDADGFSSSAKYHFESGALTRIQGPPPAGQSQGLVQTMQYDDAGRITRVTTENNGAYTRYLYGADYLETLSSVNNVADEAFTFQLLNGTGQVFISGGNHPGSSTGYKAQVVYYDVMGRVMKQSNPAEINGSWVPAGDDAAGWIFSNQTYNWQGKPLVTTNQDGTQKYASYTGCGCAGGEVVTLTDEMGRQQKVYSDVLGRQWKTETLNWNGTVYSTTTNTFNVREQVTLVRQWSGAENGGGAYQDTTMSYDGYGRLQTKHLPEQNSGTATVYGYNADDTINSVTDARGATSTYGYNARHQVTSATHALSGESTIAVSYGYDAAGNRTSMTDGTGSTSYSYDQLSRMSSETRTFNGLSGSFTLSYVYNLAGELASLSIPFTSQQIGYNYDATGRLSNVTAGGFSASYYNWQTQQTYTQPVTIFASNIAYRAWGGRKSMTYGNNTSELVSYNTRLQASSYDLNNVRLVCGIGWACSVPSATMSWTYDYYQDGRLNHAYDLNWNQFDRRYEFDQAGRLKEAYSNRGARGLTPDASDPYRQSYTHDVWGNMTRTGQFYSLYRDLTGTYVNNRKHGWSYDAAGNVLQDDSKAHHYDAASRQSYVFSNGPGISGSVGDGITFPYQPALEMSQSYDGLGQPGKRVQTTRQNSYDEYGSINGISELVQTSYYMRSSVLGGAITVELEPNGQGGAAKKSVWIYAGGRRIAKEEWGNVTFEHHNQMTGSWVNTAGHSDDRWAVREERDPVGAELPLSDPVQQTYVDMKWSEPLFIEGGDPFDYSGGYEIDGLPVSASEFARRTGNGSTTVQRTDGRGNVYQANNPLFFGSSVWVDNWNLTYSTSQTEFPLDVGDDGSVNIPSGQGPIVTINASNAGYFVTAADGLPVPQNSDRRLTVKDYLPIREEIAKALQSDKCRNFIDTLVGYNYGAPYNSSEDFLPLSDYIFNSSDGGVFWGPGSGIQIGNKVRIGSGIRPDLNVKIDAAALMHELIHRLQRRGGSDDEFDRNIRDLGIVPVDKKGKPLPFPTGLRDGKPFNDWSGYWDTALRNACFPTLPY